MCPNFLNKLKILRRVCPTRYSIICIFGIYFGAELLLFHLYPVFNIICIILYATVGFNGKSDVYSLQTFIYIIIIYKMHHLMSVHDSYFPKITEYHLIELYDQIVLASVSRETHRQNLRGLVFHPKYHHQPPSSLKYSSIINSKPPSSNNNNPPDTLLYMCNPETAQKLILQQFQDSLNFPIQKMIKTQHQNIIEIEPKKQLYGAIDYTSNVIFLKAHDQHPLLQKYSQFNVRNDQIKMVGIQKLHDAHELALLYSYYEDIEEYRKFAHGIKIIDIQMQTIKSTYQKKYEIISKATLPFMNSLLINGYLNQENNSSFLKAIDTRTSNTGLLIDSCESLIEEYPNWGPNYSHICLGNPFEVFTMWGSSGLRSVGLMCLDIRKPLYKRNLGPTFNHLRFFTSQAQYVWTVENIYQSFSFTGNKISKFAFSPH